MASILRDWRHEEVTIGWEAPLHERRFPDWSMAYSGPSLYIDRHVAPLLEPMLQGRDRRETRDRLLYLMEELAKVAA